MEHRVGEFVGPYTVIAHGMMSKKVLVQREESSKYEKYSTASAKPYIGDENEEYDRSTNAISIDYLEYLCQAFADFKTPMDVLDVLLTEVIQSDDPNAKDPRMAKAIQDEVKDLPRRGTFKVILKKEILEDANILTARYVLAIKSTIDGKVKFKARYIVSGHWDMLKHYLMHNAHTFQAHVRSSHDRPGIHSQI